MAVKSLDILIGARNQTQPALNAARTGVNHFAGSLHAPLAKTTQMIWAMTGALLATKAAMLGLEVPKAIVSLGAGFEHTLARVKALTEATRGQFQQITMTAMKMGRETQFTSSDAAEAMAFLALAGHKVNNIIGALPPTLNLAAAGQLSIAEAADISNKIMAGMGITVENLTPAIDVLAKAFTTANTDLSQLGEAMKYVGPIAKSAGIQFEEIVASIQLLSNAGIQAQMAGTTMRGAILSLTDPSKEAAELLRKFSIEVGDAQGNVRPLVDIVGQFENALAGLGTAERLAILGRIFDARQAAGFAELVAQGAGRLEEFTTRLEGSAGTAKRIAETQMDTLTGSWLRFTSAVEALGLTMFASVKGVLRGSVDAMVGFTTSIEQGFMNLAVKIGPVIGQLLDTIASIIVAAWQIISTALSTVGNAIGVTFSAIGSFFGNFGVEFAGIKEVILFSLASIEFGFTHWRDVIEIALLDQVLSLVRFANQLQYFLVDVIPTVLVWFANNWRDIFTDIWNFTKTVFTNMFTNVTEFFKAIWSWLKGDGFNFQWTGLLEGFEATLQELPVIAARNKGNLELALETEVDALKTKLGEDFFSFINEKTNEAERSGARLTEIFADAFKFAGFGLPTEMKLPELPPTGGGQMGDGEGKKDSPETIEGRLLSGIAQASKERAMVAGEPMVIEQKKSNTLLGTIADGISNIVWISPPGKKPMSETERLDREAQLEPRQDQASRAFAKQEQMAKDRAAAEAEAASKIAGMAAARLGAKDTAQTKEIEMRQGREAAEREAAAKAQPTEVDKKIEQHAAKFVGLLKGLVDQLKSGNVKTVGR